MEPITLALLGGLALLALTRGKANSARPKEVPPSPATREAAAQPGVPVAEVLPPAPISRAPVQQEVQRIVSEANDIIDRKRESFSEPREVATPAQDDTHEDHALAEQPASEPEHVEPVEVAPSQATEEAAAQPGVPVAEVLPPTDATDSEEEDARAAALELATVARALLERGQGGQLGTRNRPSERVRELQKRMGMPEADADGIYGPATRARARELGAQAPVRK